VMGHRIVLGFDAIADNIAPPQVIERIVAMVPPPTPVWNAPAAGNSQRPAAGQPHVAQPEFH
jgi:MoxR-like ATPase